MLDLLADGLGNRAIASRLFLSDKTVPNHVSNILAKLQVADRQTAARPGPCRQGGWHRLTLLLRTRCVRRTQPCARSGTSPGVATASATCRVPAPTGSASTTSSSALPGAPWCSVR